MNVREFDPPLPRHIRTRCCVRLRVQYDLGRTIHDERDNEEQTGTTVAGWKH